MLEIAVLGLLKEQPLHGYELKKRLSETLGFLWGVSYGSLYPALRRLEREGAIEVVAEPTPKSAPIAPTGSVKGDLAAARRGAARGAKPSRRTRKAYRITPAGIASFEELLLADDPHADDRYGDQAGPGLRRHPRLAGEPCPVRQVTTQRQDSFRRGNHPKERLTVGVQQDQPEQQREQPAGWPHPDRQMRPSGGDRTGDRDQHRHYHGRKPGPAVEDRGETEARQRHRETAPRAQRHVE